MELFHQLYESILKYFYKVNVFTGFVKKFRFPRIVRNNESATDCNHLIRHKTNIELMRISAAVMGIEFAYAAETAFVSPMLLQAGIEHKYMTLVWAVSPLLGAFICPLLGSMSDQCKSRIGRRRPFILLLSLGIVIGLLLIPNAENLGYKFGDKNNSQLSYANESMLASTIPTTDIFPNHINQNKNNDSKHNSHYWRSVLLMFGTVLLDASADACQSPARAYLLDVCISDDHAKGLSTFTIMAGMGGLFGYTMGAINWSTTVIGQILGGHIQAVFKITILIFMVSILITVTSFNELSPAFNNGQPMETCVSTHIYDSKATTTLIKYERLQTPNNERQSHMSEIPNSRCVIKTTMVGADETLAFHEDEQHSMSLRHYLHSVTEMPHSLQMVALTNLFCWMAHVSYSLYFTDFVGEAVFHGNPEAVVGSKKRILYDSGVRFGCWGMGMYSLSCTCYSLIICKLIKRFRLKRLYMSTLLAYSIGMMFLVLFQTKFNIVFVSWFAGLIYATLFTIPYILVAYYHSISSVQCSPQLSGHIEEYKYRGLGTDISIVHSMVFVAQFIVSIMMGTMISLTGTTAVIVCASSLFGLCGALLTARISYFEI